METRSILLTRLAKLEEENVSLQEEILKLKKQIRNLSSQPSTPAEHPTEDFQETLRVLERTVMRAVEELRKYRESPTTRPVSPDVQGTTQVLPEPPVTVERRQTVLVPDWANELLQTKQMMVGAGRKGSADGIFQTSKSPKKKPVINTFIDDLDDLLK